MLNDAESKAHRGSLAALGASVLAHAFVAASLLRAPTPGPANAPARSAHDVSFFAPSRALAGVAAAPALRPPSERGDGLPLPTGPQPAAQAGPGSGGRAGEQTNHAPRAAPRGRRGPAQGAGDDASTVVVYPFGEGMTRPQLLSGRDPQYTPAALALGVEGTVIARCVIGRDGQVRNCRVVQGVEPMTHEVVAALESRQYAPVIYQGRAVDVEYVFRVRLVLKNDAPPAVSAPPKPQEGRTDGPRFA